MSLYKLPHGQYGYTGHVVNLPQDVASFAYNLPRLPSDLDVLVVTREGANHTHRDFRVRRGVVHRALQWLVTRNQYYHSLCITIDSTALEQLPQDGNVSDLTDECSLPDIPSTTTTTATSSTPTTSDTVDFEDNLPQSFVPMAAPSMTEQEAVQQSVPVYLLFSHTSDVALHWRSATEQRDTSPVPSPPSSPLEQVTSLASVRSQLSGTISNT